MKQTNLLLWVLTMGAMTFSAGNTSAFPLYLNSASGSITATAHYGATAGTTSNRVETVSVSLKKLVTLVSNEVFGSTGTNVPADVKIVFDPYRFITYLTNSSGFYHNLSGIARFSINDIATSFHGTGNGGGTESDTILVEFRVSGHAPNGGFYEFDVTGQGSLTASLNASTGIAHVAVTLGSGAGPGTIKGSDDGVSRGGFTLRGSGTPPVNEPYSIFWWNN